MREGSNEAHGCLTSEVPSLASWGRLRHIYPPNLWLIPEDFNPVPGDPLLKSLATTLIKHTWSGQSSSSRLLENCRQVCWSRLEINFPGEWVPGSRVEDLWHIPSPKIISHSPIHVMKRIEFLKTHISPTHSSFLFHMRVYIDQSSLHTKECCKCFCICCLTCFFFFFFSHMYWTNQPLLWLPSPVRWARAMMVSRVTLLQSLASPKKHMRSINALVKFSWLPNSLAA